MQKGFASRASALAADYFARNTLAPDRTRMGIVEACRSWWRRKKRCEYLMLLICTICRQQAENKVFSFLFYGKFFCWG